MDDAVILPCGHSFGGGGMQHVLKMVSIDFMLFILFLFLNLSMIPAISHRKRNPPIDHKRCGAKDIKCELI